MTDVWNESDLEILREQFPAIFSVEHWFTDEEMAIMEAEEDE